ncbi:MAG: hypothetical protein K1X88_09410 [Nannocystaceae bacterium]|nr:hypothetical protein [Nannocystaceae bacterium]
MFASLLALALASSRAEDPEQPEHDAPQAGHGDAHEGGDEGGHGAAPPGEHEGGHGDAHEGGHGDAHEGGHGDAHEGGHGDAHEGGHGDTPQPARDADAELDGDTPETDRTGPQGRPVPGHLIETLVRVDPLDVRSEIDLLPGEVRESAGVVLTITAELNHDFDSEISELELGFAVSSTEPVEFAWTRLHTAPLHLQRAQLERKMPYPTAVLTWTMPEDTGLAAGTAMPITMREEYEELELPRLGGFAYLAAIGGYVLVAPTERDVLRILEGGGPVDHAALAGWAGNAAAEGATPFDDATRGRIMDAVITKVQQMRAPPGFGDFQRLVALTALAQLCVRPADLERMLLLQRPMTILLASAQVSYDGAASEESVLGVSVHALRRLQSRSDSALAWEQSLARLRTLALDRVLRLAADPLDFGGKAGDVAPRTSVQVQATQLLEPLTTTQAARVLASAGDRPEVQREVLRFYVEMRFGPAVEPLLDWLVSHPGEIEDVGVFAMERMGDAMLPVLLRRFDEIDASMAERLVVWRLLAALPERWAPALAAACRSLGVDVGPEGATRSIPELLDAVRDHDVAAQQRRTDELVERIQKTATDRMALRLQLQAAGTLAETAPAELEPLADAIIAQHVTAAREADADAPGESRAALRRLEQLPLGSRQRDAQRAVAMTRSELAEAHDDVDGALAELERHEPELEHPQVRGRYIAILGREYDRLLAARAWPELDALFERAEPVADDFELELRREHVQDLRRRPLVILGIVLGTVALAAGVLIAHKRGWLTRAEATTDAATTDPSASADARAGHEHDDDDDDDDEIAAASAQDQRPTTDSGLSVGEDFEPRGADGLADPLDAAIDADDRDAAANEPGGDPAGDAGAAWTDDASPRSPLDDFAA